MLAKYNTFIFPFCEYWFIVMIPNFKHNGEKKLTLLINLIFVLQFLKNCPVKGTRVEICCAYVCEQHVKKKELWIKSIGLRYRTETICRGWWDHLWTVITQQRHESGARSDEENISCHPVCAIAGELRRDESPPSHEEYGLNLFCLLLVQIPTPSLLVVWLWTRYLTCVNFMSKCSCLCSGVFSGGYLLVHHSQGYYEDQMC